MAERRQTVILNDPTTGKDVIVTMGDYLVKFLLSVWADSLTTPVTLTSTTHEQGVATTTTTEIVPQPEQATFGENLRPIYRGTIGLYDLPYVCWDYLPNWFDRFDDIPAEPNSEMHIMGDEIDGYGERMTICLTPTRVSAVLGIEKVYRDNDADKHARERGMHMCEICFGYTGKGLVLKVRHNREVRKIEVPKWTKLERADNYGIRGVGRPLKIVKEHDNE